MNLPDAIVISPGQWRALAQRLGVPDFAEPRLLEPSGTINSVYALDATQVLRVPRDHPAHVDQLLREVDAIPTAVAAGVSTADIRLFDETGEILPLPYLVVERLPGRNLESVGKEPQAMAAVWRALGRDLGRLHTAPLPAELAQAPQDEYDAILAADPRASVERRTAEGWFSPFEARWLLRWLDRLAPYAARDLPRALVHADVQMSNILIAEASDAYLGLVDWGCARIAEPSTDFLSMPLAAAPLLLEGHREVAPMPADDAAEGRILWRRLQLLLGVLPRGSARDCAWGERPVAWLIDLMRFFLNPPGERWRAAGPAD